MIKTFKIWSFLIFITFWVTTSLKAQESIETSWQKYPGKNLASGKLQNMVLRVTNTGDTPVEFKSIFDVPQGWFSLNSARDFKIIEPGNSLNIIYSFRISGNSAVRNFALSVKLLNRDEEVLFNSRVPINVVESFNVFVTTNNESTYLTAGDVGRSSYQLINRGNTTVQLKLKTSDCELVNADTLSLKPGESKTVEVELGAPSSLLRSESKSYHLKVQSRDFDTSITVMRKVEIFPNSQYKDDPYERFPVKISLNYLGRHGNTASENAFQADIFGRGTLRDSVGDVLEFHFRGPDRASLSTFGNFSEYYAKYIHKRFDVTLGDQVIRLSHLTEQNRYLRGASGNLRLGNFTIGAIYGKPRFFPDIKSEAAASLSYRGKKNILTLGSAFLIKNFANEGGLDSIAYIPSVQGKLQLKNFLLESEIAQSRSGSVTGNAYKLALGSKIKNLGLSGSILKADRYYAGFFQNSLVASGSIRYNMKRFGINLNGNYTDANSALDTFFVNAPISYNVLMGISYKTSKQTQIQVLGGQRRREDRMEDSKFNYLENVARITFDYNSDGTQFNFFSEYGRNENYLVNVEDNISSSYTFGSDLSFPIGSKFKLRFNSTYQDNLRYSRERFRNLNFGGSINWAPTNRTRMFLSYQNSYDVEEYNQLQDFFVLNANHKVTRQQQVNFSVRYTKPQNQVDNNFLFVSAKYTYDLDFPMRKKKNRGQIAGIIYSDDSVAVPNAIIRVNGYKTISDENGKFYFKSLKAGVYFLTIDPSSIGIDQIPEETEPFIIEVLPERLTERNIKLVSVAHITGKLDFPAPIKNLLDSKDTRKNQPVYIKITNGKESFIKEADTSGVFEFSNIRPGRWTISIVKSSIDKSMIFNRTSTTIEIKEGETKEVRFKAKRKQKTLKIINSPIKLTAKVKDQKSGTD